MEEFYSVKYIKLGRGAHNQHNPFHQAFLDEKDRLQKRYIHLKTHREKRRIQEELIAWVHRNNGQFVEDGEKGKGTVRVVTDQKRLLQKAAQTLREPRKHRYETVLSPSFTGIPHTQGLRQFLNTNHELKFLDSFHFTQDSEVIHPHEYCPMPGMDPPKDRVSWMSAMDHELLWSTSQPDSANHVFPISDLLYIQGFEDEEYLEPLFMAESNEEV